MDTLLDHLIQHRYNYFCSTTRDFLSHNYRGLQRICSNGLLYEALPVQFSNPVSFTKNIIALAVRGSRLFKSQTKKLQESHFCKFWLFEVIKCKYMISWWAGSLSLTAVFNNTCLLLFLLACSSFIFLIFKLVWHSYGMKQTTTLDHSKWKHTFLLGIQII